MNLVKLHEMKKDDELYIRLHFHFQITVPLRKRIKELQAEIKSLRASWRPPESDFSLCTTTTKTIPPLLPG